MTPNLGRGEDLGHPGRENISIDGRRGERRPDRGPPDRPVEPRRPSLCDDRTPPPRAATPPRRSGRMTRVALPGHPGLTSPCPKQLPRRESGPTEGEDGPYRAGPSGSSTAAELWSRYHNRPARYGPRERPIGARKFPCAPGSARPIRQPPLVRTRSATPADPAGAITIFLDNRPNWPFDPRSPVPCRSRSTTSP